MHDACESRLIQRKAHRETINIVVVKDENTKVHC